MSTPVVEHIANYVRSVIDGITTVAGYNYTLTGVRPKVLAPSDETMGDLKVLVMLGAEADLEVIRGTGSGDEFIHEWRQQFDLHAQVYSMASDTVGIETKLLQIRSDIEKAFGKANLVTTDVTVIGTEKAKKVANGKADNMFISSSKRVEWDGFTVIWMVVTVEYSVKASDPYTVR